VVFEDEKYDGVFDEQKGICASACVYAFLGGKNRNVARNHSALFIHQFYQEKGLLNPTDLQFRQADFSAAQATMGLLIEYITRKKANPKLASIAANTSPASLYHLTESDVDSLQIRYGENQLRQPRLDLYKGGLSVYSDSDDGHIFFLSCSLKRREIVAAYGYPLSKNSIDSESRQYVYEAFQAADDPEFGGVLIDKNRTTVLVDNKTIWIRVHFNLEGSFSQLKNFSFGFSNPATAVSLFSVQLESNNAPALMKVVRNNCSNI
jgi:hypothetical protein